MTNQEVKETFERNRNDIAFLLGNGINIHFGNDGISWKDLLLDLWKDHSFNTQSIIPEGVTFTEFYDALEIQNVSIHNFSSEVQKSVQEKMMNWRSNSRQNMMLDAIKTYNVPILTTNFDELIPQSMNLEFHRMQEYKFTDFYPWGCYFSDRELEYSTEGFGVWYLNGMIKYHRSIKLGLSQYMGNVERARNLIHKRSENISFEGKSEGYWKGYHTWMHIVFNRSLVIIGLSLDETEVFIRWLLIERAKYFRKHPTRKHSGWFITKKSKERNMEGKKFFLNSVGIELIELDEYDDIYEGIW